MQIYHFVCKKKILYEKTKRLKLLTLTFLCILDSIEAFLFKNNPNALSLYMKKRLPKQSKISYSSDCAGSSASSYAFRIASSNIERTSGLIGCAISL